jgi:hypothetical protein
MANDILSATALNLDASELRKLTNWPAPVIEEFLSLQGSLMNVVNNINIVINNITSVQGDINLSLAKNAALSKVVNNLAQQDASLTSLISDESATRRDLSRSIANLKHSIEPLNALPFKVANQKRDVLRLVNNLNQNMAPLMAMPAKVASQKRDLIRLINNMKQENAALQAQISWLRAQPAIESGGGAAVQIIKPSTATTHTATESNNGGVLLFNSASDCVLTLPQQSAETLDAGFYLLAKNIGGGNLSIVLQGADGIEGVQLSQNPSQAITILLQAAGAPNTWSLIGNDWLPVAVEDDALTAPPATPALGTVYIPASPATGSWTGHETEWAIHIGSDVYQFVVPPVGFISYEKTSAVWIGYNATAWVAV